MRNFFVYFGEYYHPFNFNDKLYVNMNFIFCFGEYCRPFVDFPIKIGAPYSKPILLTRSLSAAQTGDRWYLWKHLFG